MVSSGSTSRINNMKKIKYIVAFAAITASLSAQEEVADMQYRSWSRPYLRHEEVILCDQREEPIETAYSSKMRHYYDSIWGTRRTSTQVIVNEQ